MGYSPTSWQDAPSTATPLSAANLNKLEQGVLGVSTDLATRMTVVAHGSSNNTLRPSGAPAVLWRGTVTPNNMIVGDLLINVSNQQVPVTSLCVAVNPVTLAPLSAVAPVGAICQSITIYTYLDNSATNPQIASGTALKTSLTPVTGSRFRLLASEFDPPAAAPNVQYRLRAILGDGANTGDNLQVAAYDGVNNTVLTSGTATVPSPGGSGYVVNAVTPWTAVPTTSTQCYAEVANLTAARGFIYSIVLEFRYV